MRSHHRHTLIRLIVSFVLIFLSLNLGSMATAADSSSTNEAWWKIDCSKQSKWISINDICKDENGALAKQYREYALAAQQMQKTCDDNEHHYSAEQHSSFADNLPGCYNLSNCMTEFVKDMNAITAMCKVTPKAERSHYLITKASKVYDFELKLSSYCIAKQTTGDESFSCMARGQF